MCPTPLVCANDHCVNSCTTNDDCPADGECRAVPEIGLSFCIAPDHDDAGTSGMDAAVEQVPDAGSVDAGSADAGSSDAFVSPTDAGPACNGSSCAGQVAVGANFACAIRGDSTVWCWGDNRAGQLGDGTSDTDRRMHPSCYPTDAGPGSGDCSPTPVQVLAVGGAPLQAAAVACGEDSACAITTAGRIACWGGQAGTFEDGAGAQPVRAAIAPFMPDGPYVQLVAGRDHYCATRGVGGSDGVWCWGSNMHGQFGVTSAPNDAVPAGAAWDGRVLSAGNEVTCGLAAGNVACAGMNLYYAIDPTMPTADFPTPVPVPFAVDAGVLAFATGDGFSCGLLGDHSLHCLGDNTQGSLGRASRSDHSVQAVAGHIFDTFWAGSYSSFVCARDPLGQAYCWGEVSSGDCLFGPPDGGHCFGPVRAASIDAASSVAMGGNTVCAMFSDRSVQCAGYNDYGQLGNGTTAPSTSIAYTPVPVCFDGAPC